MLRSVMLFVLSLVVAQAALACLPGGARCGKGGDSLCCSNNCITVPGDNNNYCAPSDDDWNPGRCRYDSDCRWNEECNYGRCEPQRRDRCKPSGSLCGRDDSDCCSGRCVVVPGDNNNYCR